MFLYQNQKKQKVLQSSGDEEIQDVRGWNNKKNIINNKIQRQKTNRNKLNKSQQHKSYLQFFGLESEHIDTAPSLSSEQLSGLKSHNICYHPQIFNQTSIHIMYHSPTYSIIKCQVEIGYFNVYLIILNLDQYFNHKIVHLDHFEKKNQNETTVVTFFQWRDFINKFKLKKHPKNYVITSMNQNDLRRQGNIQIKQYATKIIYFQSQYAPSSQYHASSSQYHASSSQYNAPLVINSTIIQYAFNKIFSALKIGINTELQLMFDLICYKNCIQFFMQKGELIKISIKNKKQDQKQEEQFQQFKQALRLIHRLHIVHRDIKPENLMYSTKYNKNVFIDFGITQTVQQDIGDKTYAQVKGTYNYLTSLEKSNVNKSMMIDLYWKDMFVLQTTLKQLKRHQNPNDKNYTPKLSEQQKQKNFNTNKHYLQIQLLRLIYTKQKQLSQKVFLLVLDKYEQYKWLCYVIKFINSLQPCSLYNKYMQQLYFKLNQTQKYLQADQIINKKHLFKYKSFKYLYDNKKIQKYNYKFTYNNQQWDLYFMQLLGDKNNHKINQQPLLKIIINRLYQKIHTINQIFLQLILTLSNQDVPDIQSDALSDEIRLQFTRGNNNLQSYQLSKSSIKRIINIIIHKIIKIYEDQKPQQGKIVQLKKFFNRKMTDKQKFFFKIANIFVFFNSYTDYCDNLQQYFKTKISSTILFKIRVQLVNIHTRIVAAQRFNQLLKQYQDHIQNYDQQSQRNLWNNQQKQLIRMKNTNLNIFRLNYSIINSITYDNAFQLKSQLIKIVQQFKITLLKNTATQSLKTQKKNQQKYSIFHKKELLKVQYLTMESICNNYLGLHYKNLIIQQNINNIYSNFCSVDQISTYYRMTKQCLDQVLGQSQIYQNSSIQAQFNKHKPINQIKLNYYEKIKYNEFYQNYSQQWDISFDILSFSKTILTISQNSLLYLSEQIIKKIYKNRQIAKYEKIQQMNKIKRKIKYLKIFIGYCYKNNLKNVFYEVLIKQIQLILHSLTQQKSNPVNIKIQCYEMIILEFLYINQISLINQFTQIYCTLIQSIISYSRNPPSLYILIFAFRTGNSIQLYQKQLNQHFNNRDNSFQEVKINLNQSQIPKIQKVKDRVYRKPFIPIDILQLISPIIVPISDPLFLISLKRGQLSLYSYLCQIHPIKKNQLSFYFISKYIEKTFYKYDQTNYNIEHEKMINNMINHIKQNNVVNHLLIQDQFTVILLNLYAKRKKYVKVADIFFSIVEYTQQLQGYINLRNYLVIIEHFRKYSINQFSNIQTQQVIDCITAYIRKKKFQSHILICILLSELLQSKQYQVNQKDFNLLSHILQKTDSPLKFFLKQTYYKIGIRLYQQSNQLNKLRKFIKYDSKRVIYYNQKQPEYNIKWNYYDMNTLKILFEKRDNLFLKHIQKDVVLPIKMLYRKIHALQLNNYKLDYGLKLLQMYPTSSLLRNCFYQS